MLITNYRSSFLWVLAPLIYLLLAPFAIAQTYPERVSISSNGIEGNQFSANPGISADGRFVVFHSNASNLAPGDNGDTDIFVRDRQTGSTARVSVSYNGAPETNSQAPSVSADGRHIVFQSSASNIVPGDTNSSTDIFVRDTLMGSTTRVSISSEGTQANGSSYYKSISGDGRYVAFFSEATNLDPNDSSGYDIFLHDRTTGITKSIGDEGSNVQKPALSHDGRFIAFSALAPMVPEDTNGVNDIYVYDQSDDTVDRVSVSSTGNQGNGDSSGTSSSVDPSISADGRYVAFRSRSSNLVLNDTNNVYDVFVHDRLTGSTTRVSVASNGNQAIGNSANAVVSNDGRFVTFHSEASNLVAADTNGTVDAFIHDMQTGETALISRDANGILGNLLSIHPVISGDGKYVAYSSLATNLVPNDNNSRQDVFVTRNPFLFCDNNQSLGLCAIGNKEVNEGEVLEFSLRVTNANENNLTFSATDLPPGAVFDSQNAMFSWIPQSNQSGDYQVTFTVTDDGNPSEIDSEIVTITVVDVPSPPLELIAITDVFLREGQQNRNEGANPHLFIQNTGDNRTLVGFDQNAIDNYLNDNSISSALLILTIAENANNWGSTGRTVDAHPLLVPFSEGNGKDQDLPNSESTRGTGEGATWNCASDTAIENTSVNCTEQWSGGALVTGTAQPVVHSNGLSGEVSWDVTQDILSGAFSWLIKKTNENQNGSVEYFSKEGALLENVPTLAPRLLLVP